MKDYDKINKKRLITSGSFAATRNPLYVGAILIGIGFSIMLDNKLILIGLLFIYSYLQIIVIPNEEKALTSLHGQKYLDYKRRVARWMIGEYF